MANSVITKQKEFDQLCQRIKQAGQVAFDTEFMSEHTYRPRLCLVQLATAAEQVAVDPFEVQDLSAWWDIMADNVTEVIVHGGREEILFCWYGCGHPPRKLIDIQIVQGLLSRGFPLSHGAIVQKVLNKKVHGKETRTDWSKRPLTPKQIDYAVEDVQHLIAIAQKQKTRLKSTKRTRWAKEECQSFINQLVDTQKNRSQAWQKLPKLSRLQRKELVVVRELFLWREQKAEAEDRPARSVLRDDLLVDLASRQPRNEAELLTNRDMQRSSYRRHLEEIVQTISAATKIPQANWPDFASNGSDFVKQEEHVLGKLLAIALANQCAAFDLSPALLANANDLRDFVRWYQEGSADKPKLATGWRYDMCGQTLEDLLDGKVTLRVADLHSDHPLIFEPVVARDGLPDEQ